MGSSTLRFLSKSSVHLGCQVLMIALRVARLVPEFLRSYRHIQARMASRPPPGQVWTNDHGWSAAWLQPLGVHCRRKGLGLVGASSGYQVEVSLCDPSVLSSRPRGQLSNAPVDDNHHVRKECRFQLRMHVLASLVHEEFRHTLEAARSCAFFPIPLHIAKLRFKHDLGGLRLLLRKHLCKRKENRTKSRHRGWEGRVSG